MQTYLHRRRNLLLHLSFWGIYFSFFFYQVAFSRHSQEIDLARAFLDATSHVVILALLAYSNYLYFLPRFLAHKNFGRYLLEFLGPLVLTIVLHIVWKRQVVWGGDASTRADFFLSTRFIMQHSFNTLAVVSFIGMLRFAESWLDLEARKKEIENEKLAAELHFLKAQINPHFLFNTLNNLYYLAFTQSPNTTTVIEKLSQMMRYMIYDSNAPKVPIGKEIDYMRNYIGLEQLRLNTDVPIEFRVDGQTGSQMIVPFVLITFLENAFKHGVSNSYPDSWVRSVITLDGNHCSFMVENSKLPAQFREAEAKSGIGLQNVMRRLALSYPGAYTLDVQDTADMYQVHLQLTLL